MALNFPCCVQGLHGWPQVIISKNKKTFLKNSNPEDPGQFGPFITALAPLFLHSPKCRLLCEFKGKELNILSAVESRRYTLSRDSFLDRWEDLHTSIDKMYINGLPRCVRLTQVEFSSCYPTEADLERWQRTPYQMIALMNTDTKNDHREEIITLQGKGIYAH